MTDDDQISSSWAYSQNLFKDEENRPLEFHIGPSVDSDQIIKLIKNGGGEVVSADHPRAVRIVSRQGHIRNGLSVSASFIYASCMKNKLFELDSFRLQPEKFSASLVFKGLVEGIEKVIERVAKDRMANIIRHISTNDYLWKTIVDSKEFEGCTVNEIRNTFSMWAFLNLKSSKHENMLRELVSIVKNIAEEYCESAPNSEAYEKHLASAKMKRKSSESTEEEALGRKLSKCDEEVEQVQSPLTRPEADNVSSSDITTTEDHQEIVEIKEKDGDAVRGTCDKDCSVNGVESEACESHREGIDRVDKEVESCAEERTEEGNRRDSKGAEVKESDGNVLKEKKSLNEATENENVEDGCAKSGVWLDKSSMKKTKLLMVKRKQVEKEESSSSDTEPEVVLKKKFLPNKMYTFDEDLVIIKWVLKARRWPWKVQGNRVWQEFEERKILPNRSWQSMKERFKRHISTCLNRYGLSDFDIKRLKKLLKG